MEESFLKVKRKRSTGFSSAREDMISNLPDALISQILWYLPTKEAIRASVLSKRWKSLWLLIPGLDVESSQFPNHKAFMSFMEKSLDLSKEDKSCLHKLRLSIRKDVNDVTYVIRWIYVVATHKLKHLDFECLVNLWCLHSMPASLYVCENLLYLRLHRVFLGSFESFSLPRLKTMRLEKNVYANEACVESLISYCPVLEDLSIIRMVDDDVKVLRVHSQTLTTLSVSFDFGVSGGELSSLDRGNSGILIDAPRLKHLNFYDELSKNKIVSNLDSLAKVEFDGYFDVQCHSGGTGSSKNHLARDFFTGISRVRDMIISEEAMKFFGYYLVEPFPQFCNLYCLEAQFCEATLRILPMLLECCPNIKSIFLDLPHSSMEKIAPISFSRVPRCLLSSLELVEIRSRFAGTCVEREVARYFVEKSVHLKKLVVHLSCSMEKQSMVVLRDLLALSKPPSVCQIVYVADADP